MSTKEELLHAAVAVLAESGSRTLTLEAVAHRAGVSKGGLLYHFPNKKALIESLIQAAVGRFEARVDEYVVAGLPWMRAYLEACFTDASPESLGGVLAAAAEEPELLVPFREALARWYRRAEGEAGVRGHVVLLALDALWFHELIHTLPEVDSRALRLTLLELL